MHLVKTLDYTFWTNPNLWIISHIHTNTIIITLTHIFTHTHTHFHSHKYTNIPLSLDLVKTMGCILQVPRFELSLISTLTLSYSYTHSHLFSHTLTHTFSLSHQTLIINSNIEDRIYDFYFKFHEPEGERTGVKVFFQSGISDPRWQIGKKYQPPRRVFKINSTKKNTLKF